VGRLAVQRRVVSKTELSKSKMVFSSFTLYKQLFEGCPGSSRNSTVRNFISSTKGRRFLAFYAGCSKLLIMVCIIIIPNNIQIPLKNNTMFNTSKTKYGTPMSVCGNSADV
jgi:hypothetical protein